LELTVYFDDPFWVGFVERHGDGEVRVGRHVFGPEPSEPEVLAWVRDGLDDLLDRLSAPLVADDGRAVGPAGNPKRRAREAARAVLAHGGSSKAQEAMRLAIEAGKQERRHETRAERETRATYKREVARRKARDRHRGR
jgi:hypothetical protein